jgi:hypothetical protein
MFNFAKSIEAPPARVASSSVASGAVVSTHPPRRGLCARRPRPRVERLQLRHGRVLAGEPHHEPGRLTRPRGASTRSNHPQPVASAPRVGVDPRARRVRTRSAPPSRRTPSRWRGGRSPSRARLQPGLPRRGRLLGGGQHFPREGQLRRDRVRLLVRPVDQRPPPRARPGVACSAPTNASRWFVKQTRSASIRVWSTAKGQASTASAAAPPPSPARDCADRLPLVRGRLPAAPVDGVRPRAHGARAWR